MVAKVSRLHPVNARMRAGDQIGEAIDPVDQNARKQEIGENHDAPLAKLRDMVEAGLDQGEGYAGIAGFGPAKAHPLPQHPRDFGDV